MNKLFTFIVLLCSVMFSSSSFGEWTNVASYPQGDTYYVDFDRLRKHDGFYYYWTLIDKSQPLGGRFMSLTNYSQADCGKFAYKTLRHNFYEQQMGVGAPETLSEESDWIYPSPTSANEIMLEQVCDQ